MAMQNMCKHATYCIDKISSSYLFVFCVRLKTFQPPLVFISHCSAAHSAVNMFSNMKVDDLKRELKARGLSCKGNKEKLRLRLAEAVESEQDNIKPNDSASHAGSRVSTAESLILKQADEAAARAELAARLNALKEKQELEKQIAELKRRGEILSLEAEVAEVSAREEAIKR